MKIKAPIIILLLTMVVGFAAITTNFIMSGKATIGFNPSDVQVIFTDVKTDGISDAYISLDGKSITFDSMYLEDIGEEATLEYTVTNNSANYDAEVSINTEYADNDYFTFEETTRVSDLIEARSSSTGAIKITLTKASLIEQEYLFKITIDARAVEREGEVTGEIVNLPSDPGLYNSNNKLLASWDELVDNYSLDVSKNYKGYNDSDSSKFSNVITTIENENDIDEEYYKLILSNNVQKLGNYSLSNVDNLTDVVLNDGLTSVGNEVFDLDDNLQEIIFPDSITEIDEYPIGSLDKLKHVKFPPSYDRFSESMFDSCPSLENVEMSNNYQTVDGIIYSADGTQLLMYPSGRKNTTFTIPSSVTYIGEYAFEDTTYLTNVIFEDPRNWYIDDQLLFSTELRDSANAITLLRDENRSDEWFKNKLQPGLYDSSDSLVMSWDEFEEQYSIDITYGGRLIYDDPQGQYGSVSSSLIYNEELADVVKIVLPETVTHIGEQAFFMADNLREIILPNSLEYIDDGAFYGCSSLRELDIPDKNDDLPYYMCNGCTNLTKIYIPSKVNYIGVEALPSRGLNKVYFGNPNGWTVNGETLTNLSNPTYAASLFGMSSYYSKVWNRS
jgi:hypothetical protein